MAHCHCKKQSLTLASSLKAMLSLVLLIAGYFTVCSANLPIVKTAAPKAQALKLALRVIKDGNEAEVSKLASAVAKTLQITGQFQIDSALSAQPAAKKDITALFAQGYSLVIYLNSCPSEDEKRAIEWRLYDTSNADQLASKKYYLLGTNSWGWAYNLADDIWFELKQQRSSFASKIAYLKKKTTPLGTDSIICVSNFDGTDEREIFSSKGTYVGLYWNADVQSPAIYCSEFTRFKVRLDTINLQGKKRVILNFDGTCVGISVGKTNDDAVYCLSGNIWRFHYDKEQCISYHTCLIKNDGKNCTPTLLAGGDIIFCSDAPSLKKVVGSPQGPQIYYYHHTDRTIEPLTTEGYCVGPAYTPVTQRLAYSKKVKGVMQLFVYDFKQKNHRQVTFDEGNKIDSSWSSCGNYLVFCHQSPGKSRIAAMHIALKERWYITKPGVQAYYPACSPVYRNFPSL